jgi:hypothetical protein
MKYISIGHNCNPGLVLRSLSLTEFTHVFDWLITTPDIIAKLVEKNFKGFPDLSTWSRDGLGFGSDGPIGKRFFYDKVHGPIFIHDGFPSKTVEEKYMRRVGRLTRLLEGGGPILLVFGGHANEGDFKTYHYRVSEEGKCLSVDHTNYLSQLRRLREALSTSYPRLTFHILAFNMDFEGEREEEKITNIQVGRFYGRRSRPEMEKVIRSKLHHLILKQKGLESFPKLKTFVENSTPP